MNDVLVVVDMQNDFINGVLGTDEAVAIVDRVAEIVRGFDGKVIFTRDTHGAEYPDTQEGRRLPVPHCIKSTWGWQITDKLDLTHAHAVIDKPAFGSIALTELLVSENEKEGVRSVTLVGLCTDICVISNAMLIKAALPETVVRVIADACAGVTPESHSVALAAMRACQIEIE